MTNAKRAFFAVAGGCVALGIVLAAIGFIASGFNPQVFTVTVDVRSDHVVLGGVEVEDPARLPLIGQLASFGEVHLFDEGGDQAYIGID